MPTRLTMDRRGIFLRVILAVFAVTSEIDGQTFTNDPCSPTEYKQLNQPFRSTAFLTAHPETPLCDDRLRRGWFRFTSLAGGEMPTTCQETNRCGTTKPIWLNGPNPTAEDGIIMRPICANMNNSDPNAPVCCEYSEDIFVKNCSSFIVYYLYPTIECDMAYCAGNIAPCPVGKWSNTSFPPCKDNFPVLKTPPIVTGPATQTNNVFGFQCEVIYDQDDPDQRFEIFWTFNGKSDPLIAPQLLSGSERIAVLDISFLKNHLDTNIACQVKSSNIQRPAYKSDFITSNVTYFGMQKPPVLTGPIMPDNRSFVFRCDIIFDNMTTDQAFEVVWTFDGLQDSKLPPQIITGLNRTAELDGTLVKGHLGTKVGCQASLFYPESDVRSNSLNSNTYFAGIQITPSPLEMSEIDFEKYVTVTSTIPIVCNLDQDCCLTFKLNVNETSAVSLMNTCEYKICSSDWNPVLNAASVQIGVVPTRNILVSDNRGVFLSFKVVFPLGLSTYLDVFQGYKPDHLQVTIKDENSFSCSLTGDPHIQGFDFRFMYDLYKGGDFIAVVIKERDFMIQVRTVPCGGGSVACVCGIVIRERNDIIKINKCNNPNSGPSVDIAYKLNPGTIVQRSTDGYRFGVYLSSGSEVRIEAGGTNVYISIPAFDKGLGRGLCGTNDGDEANDFTHPNGKVDQACSQRCIPDAFLESWRVTGNESLFETVPDPVNTTDPIYGSSVQYCSCLEQSDGNSTVDCSTRQHVQIANTACPNCPVITNILVPSYVIGLGWIRPGKNKPDAPFVHPDVKPVDTNKQWPNDQGITEAQAIVICTQAIQKSQLYAKCLNFQQLTSSIISDCLADILYGGTTDFLDDITSAFTSQCQLQLAQNPDNYVVNNNGDHVMKTELLDNICPVECTRHGQCGEKGQCSCQDGWEGETCLIQSGKGPQLLMINGGAFCDVTQRSCASVNIDVTNINFLDQLLCKVQMIDEQGNNASDPVITSAVFLSLETITCSLSIPEQSTQRYSISATKDGIVYGNVLVVRVFDGTCLYCDAGGCQEKKTACHINNVCYKNGDADINDGNRTCDITKSTTKWSTTRSDQDRFPMLNTPPILTGPNFQINGSVNFQCQVVYNHDDPDQVFEVVWTFNDQTDPSLSSQLLFGNERNTTLDIINLKSHIDINVGCKVRTYYVGSESEKSTFLSSNIKYFGIQTPPVLVGPILPNNKSFIFQCEVFQDFQNLSQKYEVVWTFDGQQDPVLQPQVINGDNRVIDLDGALLKNHLGTRVGCQVRLIYPGFDVQTNFISSNTYFAGIQMTPDPLVMSEIEYEKNVNVISTIPIICDHDLECCLTIKLNSNETSDVTLLNSCEHELCASDWDPYRKTASIQITVAPARNILVQGSRNMFMALKVNLPTGSSAYLNSFQNYMPNHLQITVRDETAYKCAMTGDPHIYGFNSKQVYDLFSTGDYIAIVIKERDFMVQIRAVPCGAGAVSCICGVVVREGNNIIKASMCQSSWMSIAVAYQLSSGAVIQRSSDGTRVGIYLPSGSEVKIERSGTNVYIAIPAFDKGLGKGLCGTNFGTEDNAFTHPGGKGDSVCTQSCTRDAFFESWRVSGNSSLFEVVPNPVNTTESVNGSSSQYCSCLDKPDGDSTISCSARQFVKRTNTACANCDVVTDKLVPSYVVGVGWVKPGTNKPDPPFVHPEVKPLDRNKQWPSDQGFTEDQARNICMQAIQKSQLYPQCQNRSQLINSAMTDCLADILYGGTTDFLDDITSAFTSQCQLQLAQNPDNYVVNNNGDHVMKTELLDNICPIECTRHGQCGEKGQCSCQDGWEGETCLIQSGKGPQLQEIKGGALCDITQRSCDNASFYVTNINILDRLNCRVQPVLGQFYSAGPPIVVTAVFLSTDTIACALPVSVKSTERYIIAATKDGALYGNPLYVRVFDGTCLDCDDRVCQEKSTACHINDVCYKNGEADKTNINKTCDISKSTTKWTMKRSEEDHFPILDTPPTLTRPNDQINGSKIFQCEVMYGHNDTEQVFEVVWTFNGQLDQSIPPQLLIDNERVATLVLTLLKNHVDQNIGCQVRSYYLGYETSKSAFLASNTIYFGIEIPPEVTGPIMSNSKSFTFQCELFYNTSDSSQEIEVVWTFDDKQDLTFTPMVVSGSNRMVVLEGTLLIGHFGTRIGCQARLVYPESDVRTSFIKSGTYFVGIKINPSPLEISEIDFEKYITVTSTIPIICDHDLDCCLTFKLNMNETSAVSFLNSCDYKLCSLDWNDVMKTASVQVGVVPTRNILVENIKNVFLDLDVVIPAGSGTYLSIFQNYKPGRLQITVKDETTFKCSLTGDPHIMGFDSLFMYDLFKSGDFIALIIQERDFMVQIRTVPCGSGSVACICGIVVREQNNVIKVDGCSKPFSGQVSMNIAYKLSPGTIIQRSADGYRFGIYLQSGSEVRIDSGGTNLFISIPAFDKGLGKGLCGTNDGDKDNDFTHPDGKVDPACTGQCIPNSFLESWRVSGNNSLFEVVPDPVNTTDFMYKSSIQYCSCLQKSDGNSTISCSTRQHVQTTNTACPNCPIVTDMLAPSYVVGAGWVKPGTNKPDAPFVHPDIKDVDTNKQWPNVQGITEVQARNICTEAVQKSQLYLQCQHFQQLINSAISDCLSDILYGGTTYFLDDITSVFTSKCQLQLAQNPDNYVTDSEGNQVMKPELLDHICPAQCAKHGQCGEKGQCNCQVGWEGETCLIESIKGPQLLEIKGELQCDISLSQCDNIYIDISNINFLDKLWCGLQEVDVQGRRIGAVVLTMAVFISPNTIMCTLPSFVATEQALKNYTVSASKDGIVFGNELSFRVFDGTCLECCDILCLEKNSACHINNICYKNGTVYKNDANKICDVTRSNSDWTLINTKPVTAAPEVVYPTRPPRDQTLKPCQFCFGG